MKVYLAIPTYGIGIDTEIYRNHLLLCASSHGLIRSVGITQNELVHLARNKLVKEVLSDDFVDKENDYIFWLDQDIIVAPGALAQLLSHNKDIVSGLYFQKAPPFYPLIMKKKDESTLCSNNLLEYPAGLNKVDDIGFGCVLTKVSVFSKIPDPWFEWTKESGEDIDFCRKARSHGIDIWYDSCVTCGHQGERRVFTVDDYDRVFNRKKEK